MTSLTQNDDVILTSSKVFEGLLTTIISLAAVKAANVKYFIVLVSRLVTRLDLVILDSYQKTDF